MKEKPERYYVDETVIEIVVQKYPDIPNEVKFLLGCYNPRINKFEVPPEKGSEFGMMTHQDVYDMLMWTRGYRSDSEAVKCNTQLLNFLKLSLGWKEENEKNYPNPHSVI